MFMGNTFTTSKGNQMFKSFEEIQIGQAFSIVGSVQNRIKVSKEHVFVPSTQVLIKVNEKTYDTLSLIVVGKVAVANDGGVVRY